METCRRCADVCVRTWASVCLAYWTRGPVHTNSRALIPLTASKPTTLTWPHTEIWFSKKPISEEINDICVPFNHFYYKHLQCMVYENAAHCHCSFTKGKYTKNVLFFLSVSYNVSYKNPAAFESSCQSCSLGLFVSISPAFSCSAQVVGASW